MVAFLVLSEELVAGSPAEVDEVVGLRFSAMWGCVGVLRLCNLHDETLR
jgi:hypothetical protein